MPISEKRLAANRANGALSRGPITPEGKARSSQNAIKHGLQSNIVVLRNENKEAYQSVLQSYYDRFKPVDQVECGLIEEMVAAYWRTRRALAIEMNMMDNEMDARPTAPTELDRLSGAFGELATGPKMAVLQRYQTRLHRLHSRLIRDFIILRQAIPAAEDAVPLPLPELDAPLITTPDPEPPQPAPKNATLPNEPTNLPPCNKTVSHSMIEPTPRRPQIAPCEPLDIDLLT
jgi:hypothetical protein